MKIKRFAILAAMLATTMLQFAVTSSLAQTVATNGNTVIINNFDTAYQVTNNNGFAWTNWYGTAYSNVLWSADDASNNPNSGCLKIVAQFPDAGVGGQFGSQFLAINGFGPFNPGFPGNGAATNYAVTNFSCDVRILPFSVTNASGQYPLLEFGTMDTNYANAFDFGTLQLNSTQTNWVHVSFPLVSNTNWASIPGIFVKSYSSLTGADVVEVDNLQFHFGTPPPPVTNSPTGGTVIGSWQGTGSDLVSSNSDVFEGWLDWASGEPIYADLDYNFATNVVAGYPQSLEISIPGYYQGLSIELENFAGGNAAFLTNHLLSFTFSVPPAAESGSTSGWSQIYQLFINASGYGFTQQPFTTFTETGDTGDNQAGMPNYYFTSNSPARSQVVTVDYSSALRSMTATTNGPTTNGPYGTGYIQIIFASNNGGGAPTNFFMNDVVLWGGPPAVVSTNIAISRVSYVSSPRSFVLTWNATAGAYYSVQRTNTLGAAAANWPAIVTGYPVGGATGGSLSYTDTTATVGPSFYRVRSP